MGVVHTHDVKFYLEFRYNLIMAEPSNGKNLMPCVLAKQRVQQLPVIQVRKTFLKKEFVKFLNGIDVNLKMKTIDDGSEID